MILRGSIFLQFSHTLSHVSETQIYFYCLYFRYCYLNVEITCMGSTLVGVHVRLHMRPACRSTGNDAVNGYKLPAWLRLEYRQST